MYKIYKTYKGKIVSPDKVSNHCWIDIISPTDEDLMEIKTIIDIPEDIITSIKDSDEVPKVEKQDEFNFILLQTPVQFSEEEEGTTEEEAESKRSYAIRPLGLLYTPELLVTISEGKNDVINYLHAKLKNYSNNYIVKTDRTPQFILKLLLFTSKIYLRYLKIINHKIRAAQSALEQTPQNEEIINLMNLEKSLVYFSTSLHSNHIVYEKLAKRKFFTECEDDEELVEDILDENKQAVETVKIYSKIIGNVSATFASIISNNLNSTVKFLTSVTIILMIPTLIASIFGMNVKLPFQDYTHAFALTMVISILASLLGIFVFFRKKLF